MHNKAVIYARVSSVGDRQDTKRQVEDLMRYAVAADLDVVAVYEEKASGAKEDRAVLSDCITALKGGVAGTLLLSEISRLGRNVKLILEVMDSLAKSGINIHILDLNIDTLLPDGSENPIAKMLLTVLGLGAELERKNIVSRLNSGRQLAIENGVRMGRPSGTKMSDEYLLQKYPEVVKRLKKGLPVRDTARLCEVCPATVLKVKKTLEK